MDLYVSFKYSTYLHLLAVKKVRQAMFFEDFPNGENSLYMEYTVQYNVTGFGKKGLITGLVKIDFSPEMSSTM